MIGRNRSGIERDLRSNLRTSRAVRARLALGWRSVGARIRG